MVKNGKKIFLRKSAIFQPLMRGTAKQHGFLHIGANLVAKRALGQMGQIHPISTCIEEKSAYFSKYGFHGHPSWIMCRWSQQDRWAPPEPPQNTTSTPPSSCCRLPIRPVARERASDRATERQSDRATERRKEKRRDAFS